MEMINMTAFSMLRSSLLVCLIVKLSAVKRRGDMESQVQRMERVGKAGETGDASKALRSRATP